MEVWRRYCEKFLSITPREQYLIAISGLVVILMLFFNFSIDGNLVAQKSYKEQMRDLSSATAANANSIAVISEALAEDPNKNIKLRIANVEKQLAAVDKELLALTSDLIDPVQMRFALIDLLNLQKGVSLVSFEVKPVQPLVSAQVPAKDVTEDKASQEANNPTAQIEQAGLYKHEIVLKLSGSYFQLRNYLKQLEGMSWRFFWQDFHYQLKEYPKSELEVRLYSLSTKREFIGV